MERLTEITKQFPAFSLHEDLLLFNRRDSKYLFLVEDLPEILALLKGHYGMLCINGRTISHYRTTYCDTHDFDLYKAHHNGKLNRYKVRIRNYTDSMQVFLEVKFKSNKRRTIKKRVRTEDITGFSREDYAFLNNTIPYAPEKLAPSLITQYDRLTLSNFEQREKVTIDFNLEFRHSGTGEKAGMPGIGIIEVKNERGNNHGLFPKILRPDLIHYKRISKYCLGMSLLDPHVKKNRYKPKMLFIQRMQKKRYDASNS